MHPPLTHLSEDAFFVDALGQGQLDEDAVDGAVRIQLTHNLR